MLRSTSLDPALSSKPPPISEHPKIRAAGMYTPARNLYRCLENLPWSVSTTSCLSRACYRLIGTNWQVVAPLMCTIRACLCSLPNTARLIAINLGRGCECVEGAVSVVAPDAPALLVPRGQQPRERRLCHGCKQAIGRPGKTFGFSRKSLFSGSESPQGVPPSRVSVNVWMIGCTNSHRPSGE